MAGPVESRASLSIAEAEVCRVRERANVGESVGFPPEGDFNVCSEATSGWTRSTRSFSLTENLRKASRRRALLCGVPLRVNLPIERHASKIYTRSMFEQFGEALYKSFAHEVGVLEHRKVYRVTHLDVVAREKWSKVVFIVNVHDDACFFHCECGTFEHSGMVCCHSLKVMIELRLKKIPENTLLRDGQGMLGIYCLITLCGTKKTRAANVGHF